MILNVVNPPLDEALMHFGVKGMRWGVRNGKGTPVAEKYDNGYDNNGDYSIYETSTNRRGSKSAVVAGAALTVGAVAAGFALKRYGAVPIATVKTGSKVFKLIGVMNGIRKAKKANASNGPTWEPQPDVFDGPNMSKYQPKPPPPRSRRGEVIDYDDYFRSTVPESTWRKPVRSIAA